MQLIGVNGYWNGKFESALVQAFTLAQSFHIPNQTMHVILVLLNFAKEIVCLSKASLSNNVYLIYDHSFINMTKSLFVITQRPVAVLRSF